MTTDCLFCKIAKEEPEHLIGKNDKAIAILDIFPRAPGHAMVIPKNHYETILDAPDGELGEIFGLVKESVSKIRQGLQPDGFTIGINHGKNAGQAIDHLHIHIIPRFSGDNGGSIHTVVHNTPKESLEEIKRKILNL